MVAKIRSRSVKESTAAVLGFVIVPVIPALVAGILTPITSRGPDVLSVIGLVPIFYLFSALVTLVFAVPAAFWQAFPHRPYMDYRCRRRNCECYKSPA